MQTAGPQVVRLRDPRTCSARALLPSQALGSPTYHQHQRCIAQAPLPRRQTLQPKHATVTPVQPRSTTLGSVRLRAPAPSKALAQQVQAAEPQAPALAELEPPRQPPVPDLHQGPPPLPAAWKWAYEVCAEAPVLGGGAFAEVFKVRHRTTQESFAVKVMSRPNFAMRGIEKQIDAEVQAMQVAAAARRAEGPDADAAEYILQLLDVAEEGDYVYLLLDLCEQGDLLRQLQHQPAGRFDEDVIKMWARQLLLGLYVLHTNGVIHRDIKPDNLLSTKYGVLKIADFGWCCEIQDAPTALAGTFQYMAPEVLQNLPQTEKVDLWSAGVTLLQLLLGRPLLTTYLGPGATQISQVDPCESTAIKQRWLLDEIFSICPPPLAARPEEVSEACWDFLRRLLEPDTHRRVNVTEALAHPWLATKAEEVDLLAKPAVETAGWAIPLEPEVAAEEFVSIVEEKAEQAEQRVNELQAERSWTPSRNNAYSPPPSKQDKGEASLLSPSPAPKQEEREAALASSPLPEKEPLARSPDASASLRSFLFLVPSPARRRNCVGSSLASGLELPPPRRLSELLPRSSALRATPLQFGKMPQLPQWQQMPTSPPAALPEKASEASSESFTMTNEYKYADIAAMPCLSQMYEARNDFRKWQKKVSEAKRELTRILGNLTTDYKLAQHDDACAQDTDASVGTLRQTSPRASTPPRPATRSGNPDLLSATAPSRVRFQFLAAELEHEVTAAVIDKKVAHTMGMTSVAATTPRVSHGKTSRSVPPAQQRLYSPFNCMEARVALQECELPLQPNSISLPAGGARFCRSAGVMPGVAWTASSVIVQPRAVSPFARTMATVSPAGALVLAHWPAAASPSAPPPRCASGGAGPRCGSSFELGGAQRYTRPGCVSPMGRVRLPTRCDFPVSPLVQVGGCNSAASAAAASSLFTAVGQVVPPLPFSASSETRASLAPSSAYPRHSSPEGRCRMGPSTQQPALQPARVGLAASAAAAAAAHLQRVIAASKLSAGAAAAWARAAAQAQAQAQGGATARYRQHGHELRRASLPAPTKQYVQHARET